MQELTKAEEQIMQILWKMGEGIVQDIREKFPDPKPARNTVSTIVRILETKDFVDHKAYGRTFVYFPKVSKKDYTKRQFSGMLRSYFDNSFTTMTSFFVKENNLSVNDIDELMKIVKQEMDNPEN